MPYQQRNNWPSIDRGDYVVHPRKVNGTHRFNDPIKVYTMAAEAVCRRS
jgi:hypothetical protein